MIFEVRLLKEAKKDYDNLDNSQKIHVKKSFQKLQMVGGQAGQDLSGSFAGYRLLKHRKQGLRIIFRQVANKIEIIEVVAIGKRSDSEIYKIAEKRIRERARALL